MSRSWFGSLFRGSTAYRKRQPRRRLSFELVEERTLLTTLSVDINDAGCAVAGPVYCEIQQAEDDAVTGDTIKVASGTYLPVVIDTNNLTIDEADENSDPIIDATGATNGVKLQQGFLAKRKWTACIQSGQSDFRIASGPR